MHSGKHKNLNIFFRRWSAPMVLAASVALSSCESTGTLSGGGAHSDYLVARRALENGNYTVAIRHYERLLGAFGAEAGHLQLEYAHSLLRANRFDDAIRQADMLVDRQVGSLRSSALAVRGTARHEAARLAATNGTGNVTALLEAAEADLSAFLGAQADLDAAGAMRARLEMIRADLRLAG